MIDGKNFFDQPVKNNNVTYENIIKTAIGQGDDYTTGLLHYSYFKDYFKMVAVDLSKQQALDADPKAIPQINFNVNLDRAGNCFGLFTRNRKSFISVIYFSSILNDPIQHFTCKGIKFTA